ncbi:MAG: GNAT family N-acetyltransferase [Candidatus Hodarchaeota archaeon]
MNKEYIIRRANVSDAQAIHKVLLAAFEEFRFYYSTEGFIDTVLSEQKAIDRINQMNVYVAVDWNANVIGTIGWERINNEEGHIRGMAVVPNWQGKNSPAAALLKEVKDDARSKGCSILTLDTTKILQRAQNFYQKHGFRKTGKTGDFYGSVIYEYAKEI